MDWNINQFWQEDNIIHEIWHSSGNDDGWHMVAEIDDNTNFNYVFEGLTLEHYFRVKEKNLDKNAESWSNTIKITTDIDDKIVIPDVFTPNGDGYNDTWEIRNIGFHQISHLMVFNRYGKKIYSCKNEYIPWDGKIDGEVIQGTYFYQITFNSDDVRYGQLTVLQ